jgi:hypothetical protein
MDEFLLRGVGKGNFSRLLQVILLLSICYPDYGFVEDSKEPYGSRKTEIIQEKQQVFD